MRVTRSGRTRDVFWRTFLTRAKKSAPKRLDKDKEPAAALPQSKAQPQEEYAADDGGAWSPQSEERRDQADFVTTLHRVEQLSQGLLGEAETKKDMPGKLFRTELRQGLTSLTSALRTQQNALERIQNNKDDAARFQANNRAMESKAREREEEVKRKEQRLQEAEHESQMLGWASQQLDKLEQLTPRLEKATAGRSRPDAAVPPRSLKLVIDAAPSKDQLLARLGELSARIKNIVDQL